MPSLRNGFNIRISQITQKDTHDTIPKAWYSIIHEREIRPSRPCCIPRRKRTIATFGEGSSMSTGTSRTQNQGIKTLKAHQNAVRNSLLVYLQDSHSTNKPEILLAGDVRATQVPCVGLSVPDITKDRESPSTENLRRYLTKKKK